MDCSYINCTKTAVSKCECGNIRKWFCTSHFEEHIKDKSHQNSKRHSNLPSTSIEVVIQFLLSLKTKVKDMNSALLENLVKVHEILNKKSLTWFKEMNEFSKEIDSLVKNLKNNNFNISEGRLAESLKMTPDQALKVMSSWVLMKNELNFEVLIKSISDLQGFSSQLFLLYQEEKKSTNSNSRQSMNVPKEGSQNQSANIPVARHTVPAPINLNISRKLNLSESVKPGITEAVIPCCRNNHRLTFNNMIHFKYWEQKKDFMIACNSCCKRVSEATWNCLECNYNICLSCAKIRKYNTPVLECSQRHELKWRCDYIGLNSNNFRCSGCFKTITQGPRWNCKTCDFNKCVECGIQAGFTPLLSEPTCLKYHKLTKIQLKFDERNLKYCKRCEDVALENNFSCSICKDIFCLDCSQVLKEPIASHPIASCNNGHFTIWRILSFPCSYCQETSNYGFVCVPCNFKICLVCSNFLIEVVLKPITKSLNNIPLTWTPKCTEYPKAKRQLLCVICKEDLRQNGYFKSNQVDSEVCLLCFKDPERTKRNDIMKILLFSHLLNNQLN